MNNAEIIGFMVTILVALLASSPGLLAYMNNKNKSEGEAIQTYKKLVNEQAEEWQKQHEINQTQQDEIDLLVEEVECWRDVFKRWQAGIHLLVNQVVSLGKSPAWEPSVEDLDCIKKKGVKK